MLSALGFMGSGSRVIVPNIIGQSTSVASDALSAVGLLLGSLTGTTSSGANSGNDGLIATQSIPGATDADRGTSVNYTLYSYSPPASYPPSWTDNTVSGFIVGVAFSDSVSATNMQYSGTYTITSGSLPSGITLNPSTGAITGTPTTQQQYSFTLTAQNSYGSTSVVISGAVSSGAAISLGVYFDTVTSQTSLSGTVFAENTSGAGVTINLSTTAGSISPTSFALNSEAVVTPSFTVTGLSAGQTITVTASGGGASAQQSATTLASSGGGGGGGTTQYSHSFSYGLGTQTVPSGSELTASGSVYTYQSGLVTVDAGTGCGSQSFFAYTSGTWNWICYRTPI